MSQALPSSAHRPAQAAPVIGVGVPGLDFVLGGGLPANQVFLIEGNPGTGKTTLALQFLLEGVARGESTLYVTLAETRNELTAVASSHGWALDGIELFELSPPDEVLNPETKYTVFHPSDVEMNQTVQRIYDVVERMRPARIVLDSLSEMRILSQDPLRLRRQVLALKHFFTGRGCTVLLLDDVRSQDSELHFASIVHGVLMLEQLAIEYGAERRRLRVTKMRGQRYRGGFHDFSILTGGLVVYPRLIASEHEAIECEGMISSGNVEVDLLLGGGMDAGSCTLLLGPAGVGKTVLATEFAAAAARNGDRAMFFLFDERTRAFLSRARTLGLELQKQMDAGTFVLQQIDPTEVSPGQFAARIVDAVERQGVRLVAIDSLTGYLNAMPEERLLNVHLHELFSYLGQRGVTSLMTLAQHAPFAETTQAADVSYLADSVVLLRFFEAAGEVRKAISVLKKRSGAHEHAIREFRIQTGGLKVGEPLRAFQGVLKGVPEYLGNGSPLLGHVGVGEPEPA
ncbi:MAG TPA: ATPase domain-containing protein [Gemmatimonadales bacterium]|nr:ATPase domain-containing protein [Gemmatimonadales bacterium]